jgi:DNA-binding cell septation regulator SpoVG
MRGIRRVLLFLTGVLLVPAGLFAVSADNDIKVTAVKVIDKQEYGKPFAELEINKAIKIREIEIIGTGEKQELRFPAYHSSRKKVYPQVRLLTPQAVEAARRAVITRQADNAGVPGAAALRYKIVSLKRFRRPSSIKALATVRFNNALDVECKVMDGRNDRWIAWPARKPSGGGQWIKQVTITDETLRGAVEAELLDAYEHGSD